MNGFRPALRPAKGYAGYVAKESNVLPRRTTNGDKFQPPTASLRVEAPKEPKNEPKDDTLTFKSMINRVTQSGRDELDELATALVEKLPRKDLVFFITRMKTHLGSRNEAEKSATNMPPVSEVSRTPSSDSKALPSAVKRPANSAAEGTGKKRKEEAAPVEAAPVVDRRKKTAVVEKAKEPAPEVVAPVPESRKTSALLGRAKETAAPKTTTPIRGGIAPAKATTTPERGGKAVSGVAPAKATTTTPERGGKAESALKAEKVPCGAALKARVEELTKKRAEEFLPDMERSRNEEDEFGDLLNTIESHRFFNENNELAVQELRDTLTAINPLCRKVKDYLQIWEALHVPQDCQATVLGHVLKLVPKGIDGPSFLSFLAKTMKFKMNQAEVLFKDPLLYDCASSFLGRIYPTPKNSFGWSRVGWGFNQWNQFVGKILAGIDYDQQLTVLNAILETLQTLGLTWEEEKMEVIWDYASKLTGVEVDELKRQEVLIF